MPIKKSDKIWKNGSLIPWDDANIHVLSHVVNYGSAVFEGIRCYEVPAGPALFRAGEHMQRLMNSAKIYRMNIPFTRDQLVTAATELVHENRMKHCYVRPIALRGYGEMGVNSKNTPVEVFMACWEWGKYLGTDADQGVDVCISSWNRMAPNTMPAAAKAASNYMNAQLIRMEAEINGYAEGIALDTRGFVSEGSGENIFLVLGDKIMTPPLHSSILPGITRDSVITLCREMGLNVQEQDVPREMLYLADEVFFVGTAAEITALRSVDRITVGNGKRGPITEKLQNAFFAIVEGRVPDRFGWLTMVSAQNPAVVAAKR
ncbi:MAG: branched chain amino acid aminotransferase [Acidobacteria bacterium RIFCSPLOWO2_12_FULL_54_10]|nr:MAG: branched chain amino acid aminotransferase [Acidobacteria bacterium RIFCSPLOWO2_12_FULL_54_10]